jgi:hypothetical protein
VRFSVRHRINCDADRFWRHLYFEPEYTRRLYLEGLGCTSVEVIDESGDPTGGLTRKLRTEQPIDAPGPVRKLMGDSTTNVEEGTFDAAGERWRFTLTPSKMADKIKVSGEIWLEDKGEGAVHRVCDMDVTVRIFGIGSVFEKFIEKQTRESHDKAAAFTNRFLAELR